MEIRAGILKSFDALSYSAAVQLSGSLSSWLEGVTVARNIPAAEMIVNRKCAVVFFAGGNPLDAVVLAVWE